MGEIIERGPRNARKYYLRYYDVDGVRRMKLAVGAATKSEARELLKQAEARVGRGLVGMEERVPSPRLGALLDEWVAGLDNRSANSDRARFKLHVRPFWAGVTIAEGQTVGLVMRWLEQQRKAGELSAQSQRHNMALLSRFWSWAIERGHAQVNPVKMIPNGKRPQRAIHRDVPWLDDDATVVALMKALPEPLNLMFFIGNRSGLRTGEICGLRMADLEYLRDGAIRVRYSYDGPLKEDKRGEGKVKWVPAADDAEDFLSTWLKRRKLQGAGAEDLVFLAPDGLGTRPREGAWRGFRREYVGAAWEEARDAINEAAVKDRRDPPVPAAMTWYEATRHSFVSRNLAAGAQLDEVSAAVGHATPVITKQHYDHHVRRKFSALLTRRLGATK